MKFIYFLLRAFSVYSRSMHGLHGDKVKEKKGNHVCVPEQSRGAHTLFYLFIAYSVHE